MRIQRLSTVAYNMKKAYFAYILAALIFAVALAFSGCSSNGNNKDIDSSQNGELTVHDYAAEVTLDMSSETVKQEVTVKAFIDGDTTHFNVPVSISNSGVLKARYLAINTPESTGKIEEYGKKASEFTKEKLSGAASIIIESDDGSWNLDSTGSRYLVWVWYKPADGGEYRNLNIEILQNGLAIASSSANNRYGQTCMAAIAQAKALKLNIQSDEPDPDFYYGDAVELTLRELRCNTEAYNGVKVAFEGVITKNYSNSVYIEDYDSETGLWFGISVYYGYSLSGEGLDILSVGNRSRIVGTVQYYEAGGTYQVSGLTYRQMKPDDPGNIQKISNGNEPAYAPTEPDTFINGKVTLETDEGTVKEFDYAYLALGTSLSMENLTVKSVYTTENEDSSSFGAMTLTCERDGVSVAVRTVPLYDENRRLITEDYYLNKVISVRGIVDYYSGSYQIKVFSDADIEIEK